MKAGRPVVLTEVTNWLATTTSVQVHIIQPRSIV